MAYRLLYFPGSDAARLVAELPESYERIPLSGAASDPPELDGPAVLLVDATADQLERAVALKARHPVLEIVALADPANLPAAPADQVYTYLLKSVPVPLLAKTLANAFAHIQLAREQEQTKADLGLLAQELQELNAIGIKLSSERDTDTLLELILTTARAITGSDAGSLYLVEEDEAGNRRLRFKLAQNQSIQVPYKEFTMSINAESVAGYVALTGEILSLEDAYFPPAGAPFHINRAFDQQVGYRTKSMLVIPMKTQKGEIIGVLQLINRKADRTRAFASLEQIERGTVPFSPSSQDLANSLASQAAVALENNRLYSSIQTLFEGFVKASVTAIEARDPTTAGHSFRVADLTLGLAEVVDRVEAGPYGEVRFTLEEMKEIRYASLLHDFGKVGVREDVLVKAKKLQSKHVELIRQRIDVLKQGVALKYSQKRIEYLLDKGREQFMEEFKIYDAEMQAAIKELDDCLRTVLIANEPALMPEDFASAVKQLALKSFATQLGTPQTIITPEEARILSIPKGSLSEEERRQIESHVVHSFQFLAQIPWTKELKRVPLIARSHHEKLNGSGYPYGLKADEIPLQSKMMTISDIYDALTAADRPYKKAVPVDTALDILSYERKAGLIDPILLDLFIEAKVFERTRPRA
ncbi:MAG: GAF domain-containing protein [Candidatus Rokubacteria bacterium]|nr:GAF domain-containing protein [Candidatus Rokubacteria bacterium]